MLSGKLPFQGSATELMRRHQHAAPPIEKLGNVPAPIIVVVEILLAKDPGQRFQDPMQLQRALGKVKEALASGSRLSPSELRTVAEKTTEQSPKRTRRKRIGRLLIACAVCVAVLLFCWFLLVANHGPFFSQRSADLALAEKSIAVLPFESLSENKSDAYFADGVQDEILNNLAKIAQLKVISRTSVMQYRADAKRDLRRIANALGVVSVLEGTVRRDGNRVRVSTQLIDARNDNTVWADSYDRDLTDIFAIQSEIAQKVASRLNAQLSPQEYKDIDKKPTSSLEAYDLYLQGKQLVNSIVLWSSEEETYSNAISLLEEATLKDPQFALAYCLVAKAHDALYNDRVDRTPNRRALGDAAVNEALRLRPDLSEVHLAMARHLYICYRDFTRARVQIAIAAQTLPNNADLLHLTALIDQVQGRWEKATAGLERAATLDPRNPRILYDLASNYLCLRRYRDKDRILDRLIELEPDQAVFALEKAQLTFFEKADLNGVRAAYEAIPSSAKNDPQVTVYGIHYAVCARDFAAAKEILGKSQSEEMFFFGAFVPREIEALWLELLQGNHPTVEQFGAAREQLNRKAAADPTDPYWLAALALADVALGRKEQSIQEGRRAMEMLPISEDAVDGPWIAIDFALVCAWANQFDLAFEQLNTVIQMPNWFLCYGDLKTNPNWDPLRKDPRFDKLLAELAPKD